MFNVGDKVMRMNTPYQGVKLHEVGVVAEVVNNDAILVRFPVGLVGMHAMNLRLVPKEGKSPRQLAFENARVGDRVERIYSSLEFAPIGTMGTVVEVEAPDSIRVVFDSAPKRNPYGCNADRLRNHSHEERERERIAALPKPRTGSVLRSASALGYDERGRKIRASDPTASRKAKAVRAYEENAALALKRAMEHPPTIEGIVKIPR